MRTRHVQEPEDEWASVSRTTKIVLTGVAIVGAVALTLAVTRPDNAFLRPEAIPLSEAVEASLRPSGATFGPGRARVGTDVYPVGKWRTTAPRPAMCRWQAVDRRNTVVASGSVAPGNAAVVQIQRDWEWFESRGCGWWIYIS